MKKQTIIIIFLLLPFLLISSDFYNNLAEEGKKLYLSGKYEEAIENFKIAEFGLTENREVLTGMYLYYALAHFKLSNGDEVFEIIDKLKESSGVMILEELKIPENIRSDIDTMFSVIDKNYKKKRQGDLGEKVTKRRQERMVSPEKEDKFLTVYKRLRDLLKNNELQEVKTGLKVLIKLGKNDLRTRLLSGILLFRENKYKKSIDKLLPVYKTGSSNLKDESAYYLSLSNYFEKDYGLFLAFYQKIRNKEIKGKLTDIKDKVLRIRETGIRNLGKNFFNKRSLIKFIKPFNGDISISSDILESILKIVPLRSMDVYFMADIIVDRPGIYDDKFISDISDYFIKNDQTEYAIDILKRSKFMKKGGENIEILYKLGEIYYDSGNKKSARKMMLRVYKINKKYKRVNNFLTNDIR